MRRIALIHFRRQNRTRQLRDYLSNSALISGQSWSCTGAHRESSERLKQIVAANSAPKECAPLLCVHWGSVLQRCALENIARVCEQLPKPHHTDHTSTEGISPRRRFCKSVPRISCFPPRLTNTRRFPRISGVSVHAFEGYPHRLLCAL